MTQARPSLHHHAAFGEPRLNDNNTPGSIGLFHCGLASDSGAFSPAEPTRLLANHSPTTRPKLLPRQSSRNRKPLSSAFPFNQCTNVKLRESAKSVTEGVRTAISHYGDQCYKMFHIRYHTSLRDKDCVSRDNDNFSCDKVSFKFEEPLAHHALSPGSQLRKLLVLPPILRRKVEPDRDKVIGLLRSTLHSCIQKKLQLTESHMVDPMIQQSLHYATNMFLQGFKSSSTKELCDDILRDKHTDGLIDALADLVLDFLDKYEDMAFLSYEDLLLESLINVFILRDNATVDDPKFSAKFDKIWELDQTFFFDFDIPVFTKKYRGIDLRPYAHLSPMESFISKLGEVGFVMNILQASYSYRVQLLGIPLRSAIQQSISDMDEFSDLRKALLEMLITEENPAPPQPKTKCIRFAGVEEQQDEESNI